MPAELRPLEAVFYRDGQQFARCLIPPGQYLIGSERKNAIVVREPSVSGQHACLRVRSDDAIDIEDLGSANGTFVDGVAISGSTPLRLDSEVLLGATELRFERGRLPAAIFAELPAGFLRSWRHDIGEVVVQGSTSTIRQAFDTTLGREVALRVLLPESQRRPASALRFIREAQITAQLPHPCIPPIYEFGANEDGQLFFTTRFVEGESLASLLDRIAAGDGRALERYRLPHLIQIWQKASDAVAFAHSRGVVHNALTPEVIEVGRYGEVLVTTWGLALVQAETYGDTRRVQAPSATAAPPLSACSSPEQAASLIHDIDVRTDVFALGAVLYRILTLADPLAGDSGDGLLEAALNARVTPPADLPKDPPRPHWPGGRRPEFPCAVAMKALSYAREDRHQSVLELQREIAAWQEADAGAADLGAALWKQFTGLLRPH